MIRIQKKRIPEEHQEAYRKLTSVQSAQMVKVILIVMACLQSVQLVFYVLSDSEIYNDVQLMAIKCLVILLCVIFAFLLDAAAQENSGLHTRIERILTLSIGILVVLAVFNTFKAQSITSDISIYLLTMFTISAVVRMQPKFLAMIYIMGYALFFVGMPYFQFNTEYLISHRVNGLIFNIIAFVISYLFYTYSMSEFLDKLEIKLKNKELTFLAQHDGLTGLYNHQTIHELLENALVQIATRKTTLSILLIDLDYFKEVNDVFGHNQGDTVLKQVSQKIISHLRINDKAGRYGGDEFLVVLPDTTEVAAETIANKLLKDVQELKLGEFDLSFSCGVAQWKDGSATHFIERADRALYQAKNEGRNRVIIKV